MARSRQLVALVAAATMAAMLPAAGAATELDAPEGVRWVLQAHAAEEDLVDISRDVPADLLLDAGTASGSGGCNNFSTSYQIDGLTPDEPHDPGDFIEQPSRWIRVARLPADMIRYVVQHREMWDQLPPQTRPLYGRGALYEVSVAAYNAAGKSPRTNVGAFFTTPEYGCP